MMDAYAVAVISAAERDRAYAPFFAFSPRYSGVGCQALCHRQRQLSRTSPYTPHVAGGYRRFEEFVNHQWPDLKCDACHSDWF